MIVSGSPREIVPQKNERDGARDGGFKGREGGIVFLLSNEGDGHLLLWEAHQYILASFGRARTDTRTHTRISSRTSPCDFHAESSRYTYTHVPPLAINTSAFTSVASCVNATR